MPIFKYRSLVQEILICKKCSHPVEEGCSSGYYSCQECNAWVTAVEWRKEETT